MGEKWKIHGGQRPREPGSGDSADPRPLACGRDTPPPRCTSGKKTGCRSTNTSLQAHPQPPPTSICESQGGWASKILSLFSLLAATASPLAGGLGSDCAGCVQTLGWTLFPSQGTETEAWSPLRTVGPGSAMHHVSPGGGKVETRTPGRGGHGQPPGPPAPGPSPRGSAGWVPGTATSHISVGAMGRLVGQHGQPGCHPPPRTNQPWRQPAERSRG